MLTDPSVKFLIRLSTCLIGIASFLGFLTVINTYPEQIGAPGYVFDHALRLFGLLLAISMGVLWFYVGSAWETAGSLTRWIIAFLTLPPLPFLLIGAVMALVYLATGLFFAAIFLAVCFSPSTYRTYCHHDRYRHHHHHHRHWEGC
jgi:hypothetical protein